MHSIFKKIQMGVIALVFSAGLSAQQAGTQQHQKNATGVNPSTAPASNPGFSEPTKNDLSGTNPRDNSTYQKDRNGRQEFDLGWLGLLGLAGLFGFRGGSNRTQER